MKAILNKLSPLSSYLEEQIETLQETFDNRSERWQESGAGEAFQEKIDQLQTLLDEVFTTIELLEN